MENIIRNSAKVNNFLPKQTLPAILNPVNYKTRNILNFGLLLLIFFGIIFAFFQIDGEAIVKGVGLEKGYFFLGALAFLGGISSFTGGIFLAIIATFTLSGANPLLIGLAIAPGMLFSDFVFYKLLERGKVLVKIPPKIEAWLGRVHNWLSRQPRHIFFMIITLGFGLIPMPGDIAMAFLVSVNIKFKKILLPFLFAHIIFGSLYAYLIRKGIELFV